MSQEYKQFQMKKYSVKFLEEQDQSFVESFPFCFCFWRIIKDFIVIDLDRYISENTKSSIELNLTKP